VSVGVHLRFNFFFSGAVWSGMLRRFVCAARCLEPSERARDALPRRPWSSAQCALLASARGFGVSDRRRML